MRCITNVLVHFRLVFVLYVPFFCKHPTCSLIFELSKFQQNKSFFKFNQKLFETLMKATNTQSNAVLTQEELNFYLYEQIDFSNALINLVEALNVQTPATKQDLSDKHSQINM